MSGKHMTTIILVMVALTLMVGCYRKVVMRTPQGIWICMQNREWETPIDIDCVEPTKTKTGHVFLDRE